jgi:hypothetical protein
MKPRRVSINEGNKIQDDKTGGKCSTQLLSEKRTSIFDESLLKRSGINMRVILKWILQNVI